MGNAKKVVLLRCHLIVNMTNCCIIEGIQKNKQYEFKQYSLHEILIYSTKKIQKISRTFEIRVERSLALPT